MFDKGYQLLCSKCFDTISELLLSTTYEKEAVTAKFYIEKLPQKLQTWYNHFVVRPATCRSAILLRMYSITKFTDSITVSVSAKKRIA